MEINKKSKNEKTKNSKSQIQCFLEEKQVFSFIDKLEKTRNMKNENQKKSKTERIYNFQISDSMFSKEKTYVFEKRNNENTNK